METKTIEFREEIHLNKIEFSEEVHLNKNELIADYREMSGEFESINRLASTLCGTPVSFVNFLDDDFQYTISMSGDWSHDLIWPIQSTICQYTVLDDELLVINDTQLNDRVNAIQELKDHSIRFYAGIPIKSPGGIKLGTLCVIDFEPRQLTEIQLQSLQDLTIEAEYRIRLYKQNKQLHQNAKNLRKSAAFLNNSTDVLWAVNPSDFIILESNGSETFLSISDAEIVGKSLFSLIKELNVQKYLRDWTRKEKSDKTIGLSVKFELDSKNICWLSLTFSKFEDTLLITGKNITEQHKAEQYLKSSLKEKEVLLSEVHHRVKNNLAIIHSLLMMERLHSDNETIQSIISNSESRIITISKIHELLYKSKNFDQVELSDYISDLYESLNKLHSLYERNIEIELQILNVQLNVNQALPLGLIINELVTNSIKHAFKDKDSGLIHITAYENKNGIVHIEVKDNGNGLDFATSELQKNESMGFSLINTLKDQLAAEMDVVSLSGLTVSFEFQKNNFKGSVSNMKHAI